MLVVCILVSPENELLGYVVLLEWSAKPKNVTWLMM
jgi:hypothetical protein